MASIIIQSKVSPSPTVKGMLSEVSYVNEERISSGSMESSNKEKIGKQQTTAIESLQIGTVDEKDKEINKGNKNRQSSIELAKSGIFEMLTGQAKTKTKRPPEKTPTQKSRYSKEKHSDSFSKEKAKSRNQLSEQGMITVQEKNVCNSG